MKIWRPYTQMKDTLQPLQVTKASGAYLYLDDGRKIFDGISSWWVITHGHCYPEMSEAIARQSEIVDQVVFANFSHPQSEELSERLSSFLPPELNHVFFSDNGSTAVEVAMKMAYQHCRQSGQETRKKFISFERAYHGDTCGAMSVTGNSVFTQSYPDLRFEVLRAKQGAYLSEDNDSWTKSFENLIDIHGSEVAAVIIEPLLQGAGGMIVWPLEALKTICRICQDNKIPIIFDEVMTGFGRCGEMFAFQKVDYVPDFLCLSKGLTGGALPLSLTITKNEIFDSFLSADPNKMFFHGHSFTGNAISCAAANASLKIFREDDVLGKIKRIENAHRVALQKIRENLPIRDVRLIGAIGAIELDSKYCYGGTLSQEIYGQCLDQGLFLRPVGNVIYLLPPYCSTKEEIDWAWTTIADVVLKLNSRVN